MSDYPKGGDILATRAWLDKKGFTGIFNNWEADAILGQSEEYIKGKFPDTSEGLEKAAMLWGFLNTARTEATKTSADGSSDGIGTDKAILKGLKKVEKFGKILEFITKEVVIQHRVRMDQWTESKRTKTEQTQFKNELINFYQCQHPTDPQLLKCMVLDSFFPKHLVTASHIWKFCTHGEGLEEFNLEPSDINNPRNGFLMCKNIEEAFDTKRICFLIDRFKHNDLVLKVLDPSLLEPQTSPLIIPSHSFEKFSDIDSRILVHPPDILPFRRILDFHAKCSYKNAIRRGWLDRSESFDNFFDMSLGASIPDLNPYQSDYEDDSEDDDNY